MRLAEPEDAAKLLLQVKADGELRLLGAGGARVLAVVVVRVAFDDLRRVRRALRAELGRAVDDRVGRLGQFRCRLVGRHAVVLVTHGERLRADDVPAGHLPPTFMPRIGSLLPLASLVFTPMEFMASGAATAEQIVVGHRPMVPVSVSLLLLMNHVDRQRVNVRVHRDVIKIANF